MEQKKLSAMYKDFAEDVYPPSMEIVFRDAAGKATSLLFEKVEWTVEGQRRGLRYGENPDQPAALYRPVGGNLSITGAQLVRPDGDLVSAAELLQFGKHPGKTNLTDVDSALSILRYLADQPACAVMKHNNPSGVALGSTTLEAYSEAYLADRVAAFGGAVVLNRTMDRETAEAVARSYCEVTAAPDFGPGAMEILSSRKNLRVMRIPGIANLASYAPARNLDFRTLLDGACIVQTSFASRVLQPGDLLPAETEYKGERFSVRREPSSGELADMLFGWAVECGVTSNSVIFVRNGRTLGIGAGEQDRVGVAILARDKACRKLEDRLCWERHAVAWNEFGDQNAKSAIAEEVRASHGGLSGSVMVSDAFFPFRDGLDVGLAEGVTAVIQPGGSLRDREAIEACNEYGVAMKFTGQRCFRH
ncbi:MAG: IMP cyclohydrolase [Spirochaetales bacterium]|nr:MAG: IMP cyclohydrolase [Spirochaetales bacterium]